MGKQKKPRVAICYDFDGTLSPENMQEYKFFPKLNVEPKEFWKEAETRSKKDEGDKILAYMTLMLDKARDPSHEVKIDRDSFVSYGEKVKLFKGVEQWFGRINKFAVKHGLKIEHYIISSGLREMIEGTPVARHFKKIYASSFGYDQHEVALRPALAINYTTKTQFLFRINKGCLDDIWDDTKINMYIKKEQRQIPFTRMIYIGDGTTDIPCMKLVKEQGGHSIAVYKPNSWKRKRAEKLLEEDRVNFVVPADYHQGKSLDVKVKSIIRKIAADFKLQKLESR